ncbi:hypothetical protein KBX31_09790 [Liquorilactobacillus satsumensis]|uniref:hypothetical protein n=1 Tax=Liquorilactobacillus satsumensis TaxID=259059 RepID=UPI0021C2981F|nr:hypothetical protein [Liquorilactobacillus satsumensis]MCP9313561.1 hypothetical protein [Liquorilactobacillus satsumensis]MCP9360722.1 hypothetical protein [Liquorilactobacillus satsumensis]
MKADKIIADNNQQRAKLSTGNKAYYENLTLFMRGHGTLKNDMVLESSLLEILNDLIQAQRNGISAREYYGKTPQAQAQELLAAMPNDIKGFIVFVFGLLFELIGMFTLNDLVLPGSSLDVGRLLLQAAVMVPFPFMILWCVGSAALKATGKLEAVFNGIIYGGIMLALGIVMLLNLVHTSLIVRPADHVVLLVAGSLLIGGLIWISIQRPKLPFIFITIYLMLQLLLAMLYRIPATKNIMTAKLDLGVWTWPLVLLIGMLLVCLVGLFIWKHKK